MALQFHASRYLMTLMATGVRFTNRIMRKVIACIFFVWVAMSAFAQKDVTKFLGIPIDGTQAAMIQKLKDKGFKPTPIAKNVLEGVFNGSDVNVHIVTNGDKVYRIMVCDANVVDERSIQIRFNNLCRQFQNNPKYLSMGDFLIPDDEDISYGLKVKNKRYEAIFCQTPVELSDTALLREKLLPIALEKYTKEQLDNPTEEMEKELMTMSYKYVMGLCEKKPVWFMISDHYGKYYITIYYDNEYNRANGEDL